MKQLSKTVIISSHIFSTLRDTCDEIQLLKNGELIKTIERDGFQLLESEMKETSIANKIEMLNLIY